MKLEIKERGRGDFDCIAYGIRVREDKQLLIFGQLLNLIESHTIKT